MALHNDKNTVVLLHLDGNLKNSAKNSCGDFSNINGTPTVSANGGKFGGYVSLNGWQSVGIAYNDAIQACFNGDFTIDFWTYIKNTGKTCIFAVGGSSYNGSNFALTSESGTRLDFFSGYYGGGAFIASVSGNKWIHLALCYKKSTSTMYFFVDGSLVKTFSWSIKNWTQGGYVRFGGSVGQTNEYWFNGYLDEIRISNVCRWTENFDVPNAPYADDYIGLVMSKSPINLLDKTSITGITTEGIQPANTSRHVAFKVDDAWKKLTIGSGGAATLTDLATQNITATSLISEGNTAAELANVTSVPGFVGKLVYPAVALYAGESATVMPTFGMTIEGEIDTTINTYTYTDYSQEYVLNTEVDVPIVSCVADTTTTGNGSVDITARIRQGDTWSEYMSLEAVHMKEANAIQLKAVYTVELVDDMDSCRIDGVTITYKALGAVVTGTIAEIVTITQQFTNDLSYVHAYIKHEALKDAEIKSYCSLRKTPQNRNVYQIGNGTGNSKTYQLQDTGINQDTLVVYVNGKIVQEFNYNTETSTVTLNAPAGSIVSASYEYGWELSNWIEMIKGTTQVNDSGLYTTEFTYVIPSHEAPLTVAASKYILIRPEGTVINETIGVGTGKRQLFQLPHIAKKETMQCSGQWNFDQETNILTVIAPEGSDIVVSYDWIAENPRIYDVVAGWTE